MSKRLRDLKNLGPASEKMLKAVDIHTPEDLATIGAVEAFLRVRESELHPSLNLLYALEGALTDVHWNALPDEVRARLLIAVDEFKEARGLRRRH
jgi:DNA transformation protein